MVVVAATGATFLGATVGGALLYLSSAPARRLAIAAVNEILSGTFRGTISVTGLRSLSLHAIDGASAELIGPDRQRLALAQDVHAGIDLGALLGSLARRGELRVRVTDLSIGHLEALLAQTAEGSLTIADAFGPAKAGPPPPPKKESAGLDLSLPHVRLRHAWIHGGLAALPVLDAEIFDLSGSFAMTPVSTSASLDGLRVVTRAMPDGADLALDVRGDVHLPERADETSASAAIRGVVGGIDVAITGTLQGERVDAALDVPRVVPSQLDALLRSSPIHQVASVHADVHGALPHLSPAVHVTVGEGTVDLGGDVTLASQNERDTVARVELHGRDLDVRAASPSAPASRLGLDLRAAGRLSEGGALEGSYDVHLLPGLVAGKPTPEANVEGTFAPTSVRGRLHVAEPGAPLEAHFDLDPSIKGGPRIRFDAALDSIQLSQIPQLEDVRGAANLRAGGVVDVANAYVDGHVVMGVEGLRAGGVAVRTAEVQASVHGGMTRPDVNVVVQGDRLRAAGYEFPTFGLAAVGARGELQLASNLRGERGTPSAVARATLSVKQGLSARDVSVTLTREKDAVTARAARVLVRGDRLDAEGVRLEGAGDPLTAELHRRDGKLEARMSATRLDVPTLLRVAGLDTGLRAASLGLDVDLETSRRTTDGHVDLSVDRLDYDDGPRGVRASVKSRFEGRQAELHVEAHDAARQRITLDADRVELRGGALDPAAWKGATGKLHGEASFDLQRLLRGARGALPFDELRGWLTAKLDVERDDAKRRPDLKLDAQTRGLVLTTEPRTISNPDGTVTVVGRSFHSQGLDAHASATFQGSTGKTDLEAGLADARGHLLDASARATVPVDALLQGRSEALLDAPVRAHFDVPTRRIGDVPTLLQSVPVRGELGLLVDVAGSARHPHVDALVHGRDLTDADDPSPVPISFDVAAFYDGRLARARVVARHGGAQVMDVVGDLRLGVSDLLAGTPRWEAGVNARLAKFPIGAVTGFFLAENRLDGDLSGEIALGDLHKDGRLRVDLDLARLELEGMSLGETRATATLADGSLDARASVRQPDGSADVRLASGLTWGSQLVPSVDAAKPMEVGLQAKNFRIAMLAPALRSALSELDGRLNATTTLRVKPGLKDGVMDGAISLDGGLFETPAIGEELHDVRARVYMKPWGVWNVQELSASGTSGRLTASAMAHVQGLRFQSGEAHLRIAQGEKMPLAVQGMELGTVWGRVDAKGMAAPGGNGATIDVDVPDFHVMLPQSIAHGVQSTDPDPTVKVGAIEPGGVVAILPVNGALGAPSPPPPPSPAPAEPSVLEVRTHLGPDLEVRRDTTIRAYVTGGPTIVIGTGTKISGSLDVPRGYLELQGKRFTIEKAKVSFTGEPPDNPVVVAEAMYEATDGTKIFANFVGPVKTGKLTLRSEPQLSQNEILALLLFGSADGTFGQAAPPGQEGTGATQAASLAGGVVTEGLNKAISGVSGVELQTKVDTRLTGDPRPEVEVALSRDVTATIIYNLGVPPPGQNPDDTLLVVDWRFAKSYSTEATVGDKGTSILDLTWKYRY
jgi:translocation and assembly module TamB